MAQRIEFTVPYGRWLFPVHDLALRRRAELVVETQARQGRIRMSSPAAWSIAPREAYLLRDALVDAAVIVLLNQGRRR